MVVNYLKQTSTRGGYISPVCKVKEVSAHQPLMLSPNIDIPDITEEELGWQ